MAFKQSASQLTQFLCLGYLEEKLKGKNIQFRFSATQTIQTWDDLDESHLRRSIDSVITRLKDYIKANDRHFEQVV